MFWLGIFIIGLCILGIVKTQLDEGFISVYAMGISIGLMFMSFGDFL